ncbi:GNAT family N-acetyltransferase [Paenibacillus anseongense]|uniref:GNAT family N-acetyltransferase n=1 Tax=Paenibacillus anseongense TaxID=2682845 RepID=UPI002DB5A662|nr:GNAT family N-acetyltransferase [Paenibacillus anseongense]MEC0270192.1 GNAT family N-acetyltransferase [Paenibacillus anseongense]
MPDDVSLAVAWYQDPEVLYYSEGGTGAVPYDADKVERMYKYLLNKGEVFIIETQTTEGWVSIGDVALCTDCLPIEIGIGEFRSKGIGGKVLDLIIEYAKFQGRDKLLVNGIYTFNDRSRRLYESRGFSALESYIDDDGNECMPMALVLK